MLIEIMVRYPVFSEPTPLQSHSEISCELWYGHVMLLKAELGWVLMHFESFGEMR